MFSQEVETLLHQICTKIGRPPSLRDAAVVDFCSGKRIRLDKTPFHPDIPLFFPLGELLLVVYLQYLPTAAIIKKLQVLFEARSGFRSTYKESGPALGVFFCS